MHCPQCGQLQVSDVIRFCSRCGFPLEGVIQLLATGGNLNLAPVDAGPRQISARRRGVKQGGMLLLLGAVIVPLLGVLASYTNVTVFEVFTAIAAILFFIGGPLRMLYAAVFEEGAPAHRPGQHLTYPAPLRVPPVPNRNVLPAAMPNPVGAWRRPNTAELANPPSVTENTTRLLDTEANFPPQQQH